MIMAPATWAQFRHRYAWKLLHSLWALCCRKQLGTHTLTLELQKIHIKKRQHASCWNKALFARETKNKHWQTFHKDHTCTKYVSTRQRKRMHNVLTRNIHDKNSVCWQKSTSERLEPTARQEWREPSGSKWMEMIDHYYDELQQAPIASTRASSDLDEMGAITRSLHSHRHQGWREVSQTNLNKTPPLNILVHEYEKNLLF